MSCGAFTWNCNESPLGISAQPPGPNALFKILRYLISGKYISPKLIKQEEIHYRIRNLTWINAIISIQLLSLLDTFLLFLKVCKKEIALIF